MKYQHWFTLVLLSIGGGACQGTSKQTRNNGNHKDAVQPSIKTSSASQPQHLTSLLRPGEQLTPGEPYTDTVTFIAFDDNGDLGLCMVSKNADTLGLVANEEQSAFVKGDQLRIQWKIDSIRYAGDPEFLNYREYLIRAKPIKTIGARDWNKLKNSSFTVSCGSGCAMTYQVADLKQIQPHTIWVKFEVQTHVDGQAQTPTAETYVFRLADQRIEKVTPKGIFQDINEILPKHAVASFQEFGEKLIKLPVQLSKQ